MILDNKAWEMDIVRMCVEKFKQNNYIGAV